MIQKDQTFWVFIPARKKSTRFPNKIMASLQNKPLVCHVFERAQQAVPNPKQVFILVDDQENYATLKKFTPQVMMTPTACQNGSERCAFAAKTLGLADDHVILNVQGDEPLVAGVHIHALMKPFLEGKTAGVSTTAYPMERPEDLANVHRVKVIMDDLGVATQFCRQLTASSFTSLKRVYIHMGLYGYRRSTLEAYLKLSSTDSEKLYNLEQLRFLENKIPIYCTVCDQATVGVDTLDDFMKVEKILGGGKPS